MAAADERVIELEQEHDALGEKTHLQDKKNEVSDEIRANRTKVAVLNVGYSQVIVPPQLIPCASKSSRT